MIIFSVVGILAGVLAAFLKSKITAGLSVKFLIGALLFIAIGGIACAILYPEMLKTANALYRIRREAGIYAKHDQFVAERIGKYISTVFVMQLIGMSFMSRSLKKRNET